MANQKEKRLSVVAVPFSYNERKMYVTAIPVDKIFPYVAVSRVEEDPEEGYQRHLKTGRVKDIAEYLKSGYVLPGSVILSARKRAALRFDAAENRLSFSGQKGAFMIIDGQHRLFGAHLSEMNIPIAICIMADLSLQDEVQYFVDVNGKQRGVPRTLQEEVRKFLVEEGTPEEIRLRLFRELNSRADSPLCGRMSPDKSVTGKLSHVPFKAALESHLTSQPLVGYSFDTKVEVIVDFLRAVSRVLHENLGDDQKLGNSAFFQALFGAFREIVLRARIERRALDEESFYAVVRPIGQIEWDAHSGTNKKAIAALTNAIRAAIVEDIYESQPGA